SCAGKEQRHDEQPTIPRHMGGDGGDSRHGGRVRSAQRQHGKSIFIRRDSVVALGDSTRVVSTFAAPILDSLRRRGDTSGMARNAMLNLASNAMVTGMRVMSEQELKRLKGRIEGRPGRDSVPRPQ